MRKAIEGIVSDFDIAKFDKISKIKENVWDINDMYILKKVNSVEVVRKNVELTRQLLAKDIPVAEFITTKNVEFYVSDCDGHYLLMHKIQGAHLEFYKGDSLAKARQIGENAALLCRALKDCVFEGGSRFEYDMISYLNGEYMEEVGNVDIPSEIRGYINEFHSLYKELPRQIIHADFNPTNLIFDGAKFQGFIDFDMASRNVRIYDLCYLLQDVFQNDPEKTESSYEIAKCIFESYNRVNPLRDSEKRAIPYMLVMIGALERVWTLLHDKDKGVSDFHMGRTEWMFSNRRSLVF